MLRNTNDPKDLRELLLALLSTNATLAGLSLALVGIVNLRVRDTNIETVADDLFLFSSLGFVVGCFLIFFALRRLHSNRVRTWTNLIDALFLFSMVLLVTAGFVVVYSCW